MHQFVLTPTPDSLPFYIINGIMRLARRATLRDRAADQSQPGRRWVTVRIQTHW
ncbi:hypothetical protein [Moorena producens]|uniref:hypothetical protein n=1 Tax=Moorena producens TaxID=1155739 RepID=UPI003C731EA3